MGNRKNKRVKKTNEAKKSTDKVPDVVSEKKELEEKEVVEMEEEENPPAVDAEHVETAMDHDNETREDAVDAEHVETAMDHENETREDAEDAEHVETAMDHDNETREDAEDAEHVETEMDHDKETREEEEDDENVATEMDLDKETVEEEEDDENFDTEMDQMKETREEEHEPQLKRRRGPTRMKHIAKDPNEREHVDFTDLGEPCGPGSVLLSSYLGPLVREHVPVTVETWKKVSEDIKTVLWKSIETIFDMDEEFKEADVFKQMGCLWRASKSRLVSSVRNAKTVKGKMNLRPKNVNTTEWQKFVREKTSNAFKVVSDSYKERRQKQIPHTCGRRGMVRLREDLINTTTEPSQVSRLRVWVKSRTKKDGTPVNVNAAEKIRKTSEIELEGPSDSRTTNPKEDMLTRILGPDNPGRLRAMGRGISMTKLACLQVQSNCIAAVEEKQMSLQREVQDLQQVIARMNNQRQETDVGENSIHKSVNTRSLPKCYLVDWSSSDENVAEGRVISYDADELVDGNPLGPNAVKVLVETAIKSDTFLWRPAHQIFTIEDAVGEMIAWPADYCNVPNGGLIPEDTNPKSSSTFADNKCKLMDYITNEEVVAVGRWQTREPKALVNGLPLGPNAIKVFVDEVVNPKAFIWRPTVEKRTVEDYLKCFVAWPANRVVVDGRTPTSPDVEPSKSKGVSPTNQCKESPITPSAPTKKPALGLKEKSLREKLPVTPASPPRRSGRTKFKEHQKCKLLDLAGKKVIVAEGRWSSNDPGQRVHFVPLGPGACRVFVDVVKAKDVAVWRTTSEIEYMEAVLLGQRIK